MGQKRQTGTTRQRQKTDGPNQWERDTKESQVRHMEAKTKTAKQRQKTDRPRQWDGERWDRKDRQGQLGIERQKGETRRTNRDSEA